MRTSIGGSFLFLRKGKGGDVYEGDVINDQLGKEINQSKSKEEIKMAKKRSIKVYGQSGYKYHETPTIMLKGQWLREAGFEIGDYISVTCEDGKLIISQDAERAAVKAAEAEYMEREMKALQKRYEAEKVKIRAQMVAESGARW